MEQGRFASHGWETRKTMNKELDPRSAVARIYVAGKRRKGFDYL